MLVTYSNHRCIDSISWGGIRSKLQPQSPIEVTEVQSIVSLEINKDKVNWVYLKWFWPKIIL